jgi:hypothetical protein
LLGRQAFGGKLAVRSELVQRSVVECTDSNCIYAFVDPAADAFEALADSRGDR